MLVHSKLQIIVHSMMAKAKCFRCGASATADTFENARKQLDHAIGLSRGKKCGDSYGKVEEIIDRKLQTKQQAPKTQTYHRVEGKSTHSVQYDETKIAEPKNH